MADYKDYIVRYDIQADVTKAAEGLRAIADIAKQFEGPMKSLSTAIRDVANSAFQLKQNAQMKFAPTIDVSTFNKQLRSMVVQVRNAATEMHAALYESLSGNIPANKAMRQGIANGLKNEIKSAQQLKNELEILEKERDKLLGTPKRNKKGQITRANDGNIFYAKNGLRQDPSNTALQEKLLNYQSQEKYLRERISAVRKAIALQEKLEKETASQEKKAVSKTGATAKPAAPSSTPQPAKLTNVTPAVIREWKKTFGDKTLKNLTVNIRGNASGANGALTVIEQVQTALKSLQSQSSFNINPILNVEAFAAAEAQLRKLAALSSAITAPFIAQNNKNDGKSVGAAPLTKDEKAKLTGARKQIKALTEKITPIQSRLDANQAKYAENPTPGLKGQITRDTKSLTALQASKAEQENIVKGIQSKTSSAVQSTAKGIKPLAIDIIGNLTAINTPKAPFTVPLVGELTKLQGKITEAIPVNIKIFPDQVAASIKALPPQTINVGVHLIADNIPQQLKSISEQKKPVAKQKIKTPATATTSAKPVYPKASTAIPVKETSAEKTKKVAKSPVDVTGKVDTKDIISQIKAIPRQSIPVSVKLMWDKGAIGKQTQLKEISSKMPPIALKLETTAAIAKLEEFIARVKASTPQNIKLTATAMPTKEASTGKAKKAVKSPVAITAQVDAKDVASKIKAIPRQAIPVSIKLMWDNGIVGTQAQLKELGSKMPNIALKLDTTSAIAKLEEFVALVKASSPQNIKLTASGTTQPVKQPAVAKNATAAHVKESVKKPAIQKSVATVKQDKPVNQTAKIPPVSLTLDTSAALTALEAFIAKIKASSPQNIKLTASDVPPTVSKASSVADAARNTSAKPPISTLVSGGTTQNGKNKGGGGGNKPLTASERYERNKSKAEEKYYRQRQDNRHIASKHQEYATQQSNWYAQQQAMYNHLFRDLPRMSKPDFGWAERQELRRSAELSAMREDAKVAFAKQTPFERKEKASAVSSSVTRHARQAEALRNQARNAILPFVKSESQANTVLKNRRFFREAVTLTGINPAASNVTPPQMLQYYRGVADWMQANKVAVPWQLQDQINKLSTQISQNTDSQRAIQRKAAVDQSIARHQQRANRLKAQAQNSMLPFAQNKEQLNMLTKHRKFFRQAVTATGIIPTPGMEAPQMLRYLQGVSSQMKSASVAVPWQLQSQINKLEGQIAKSNGIGNSGTTRGVAAAPMPVQQKPYFDRARKWAYPFTGQTSFGARTPMAVDMAKGMGVMFAIGGAMSAVGSSFSQAMEYQNTMKTTQAILQNGTDTYSHSSFRNMEETVRNVGVKTKFSAPEVASAARFLAMAGYDIDAINASIRPIADLALIGDSDLGETADKMTNIMTTFQIAPEKMREAANIMATTATRSNTDLMMLAESAKYGGGVANMYGRNDPNLFADTMALFGVMGNAGIQASSAGTALRMMYQNIFKPNKNQKKVLDMLEENYGIKTIKDDGGFRSMSDILVEIAQRVPENQMAQVVGNLFRITAQPGASAALLAAAGGDKNTALEIGAGIDVMSNKMSSKAGLSSLVALMLANRESINGNISGSIAEDKQNTPKGLWAQVTSTFTEGILRAFEKRQGGFEEMLRKLRDYFAKPETIQMMQNLLDMIVEIGKVMAWFVKIWANLYNLAPGLIKGWVITQMFFTQMGALIAPAIQLIGVLNRLGGVITRLSGISAAVAGVSVAHNLAGNVIAGTIANTAPFTPIPGSSKKFVGKIGSKVNSAMDKNAILAGELALSGASKSHTLKTLNQETAQHYKAVQERYYRRYGWARVGAARRAARAVPTLASFAPVIAGIKSMFMGLLTTLAKGIGLLTNPITIAVSAFSTLGYFIYKFVQWMNGATGEQRRSREQANKAADQTTRELTKEGRWYKDLMNENIPEATHAISSVNTEQIAKFQADKERINQLYASIFNDFSKGASKQSVEDVSNKWKGVINSNPQYRLAIGNVNSYDFSKNHKRLYNPYNGAANATVALLNLWHEDEDKAINQRLGMVQDALMIEGANSTTAQKAIKEIADLRKKYLAKAINPDTNQAYTEAEYQQKAQEIRNNAMGSFTASISAEGMTPERFRDTTNRSVFIPYQTGVANLLDATINGQLGTIVGKINAYDWLSDTKNKALAYTSEWYNAISHIINGYKLTYDAVSDDGKLNKEIELILSTLPNGQLDFKNISDQITSRVANFQMTLQNFTDIIGAVYKAMAEAGIIDINSKDDLKKMIRQQMTGGTYTDKTVEEYYAQFIAPNPNSEWIKAGIGPKQYVDFVRGRSGNTIKTANRIVSRSDERQQMYNNLANQSATKIYNQYKGNIDQLKALSGNGVGNSNTAVTNSQQTSAAKDQMAYASPYEKAASRPTHISIHINELAHFDRTMVASSAEERDLIAAMEPRITDALYQVFAQAANQAQNVIDLT